MKSELFGNIGIKLISENEKERDAFKRFFKSGVKPNVLINDGEGLEFTFADLIGMK